jgi:hypothetical protein
MLFGHPAIGTENAALRYLQLDNPHPIDAYKAALCQQLDNHNVETIVILLNEIEDATWSNNDQSQFDKIDHDTERAMKFAANKCRYTGENERNLETTQVA